MDFGKLTDEACRDEVEALVLRYGADLVGDTVAAVLAVETGKGTRRRGQPAKPMKFYVAVYRAIRMTIRHGVRGDQNKAIMAWAKDYGEEPMTVRGWFHHGKRLVEKSRLKP